VDKINGEILKAGGEKISKIAEHLWECKKKHQYAEWPKNYVLAKMHTKDDTT
jgi:hypothetical protein